MDRCGAAWRLERGGREEEGWNRGCWRGEERGIQKVLERGEEDTEGAGEGYIGAGKGGGRHRGCWRGRRGVQRCWRGGWEVQRVLEMGKKGTDGARE